MDLMPRIGGGPYNLILIELSILGVYWSLWPKFGNCCTDSQFKGRK